MAVSDAIYGRGKRYVSRERLQSMLRLRTHCNSRNHTVSSRGPLNPPGVRVLTPSESTVRGPQDSRFGERLDGLHRTFGQVGLTPRLVVSFVRNGLPADLPPHTVSVWELTGYESESPTAPLTSGAGLPGLEKAPPVNVCMCCTAPERKRFQLRPNSGHPHPGCQSAHAM
jgi:hypothetical protein